MSLLYAGQKRHDGSKLLKRHRQQTPQHADKQAPVVAIEEALLCETRNQTLSDTQCLNNGSNGTTVWGSSFITIFKPGERTTTLLVS